MNTEARRIYRPKRLEPLSQAEAEKQWDKDETRFRRHIENQDQRWEMAMHKKAGLVRA